MGQALKLVHPSLEFSEFLRLIATLMPLQVSQNEISSVADEYSYSLSDGVLSLASLFNDLPKEFQIWCDHKKLKFSDLRPLLRVRPLDISPYLQALSQTSASKSQGTEILELLVDLLGVLKSERFMNEKNPDVWFLELRKLAHPTTVAKDDERANKVRKFSWPVQTKGSWMRWGDQAGLSIQIQSSSPKDLEKKLEELKRICGEWEQI